MSRILVLVVLLAPFAACGGGEEGGNGGGEPAAGPAPLAPLELVKKTATDEFRFVMQAPEGATAEWSTAYFFVSHPEGFALRVTPRWHEDLEKQKASYGEMNIKGHEVLVDEPDALLVRVDYHHGTDYEVLVNATIGDRKVSLTSTELIGKPYTREQAERLLECSRTLAALE
jgi:hypothetical protein